MSERGARPVLLLAIAAIFLWGCEGDDGAAGPAGPQGPAGPEGPPGPPGPSSSVPITSADRINAVITSVAVPADGGAPTVELTLTNDLDQGLTGLPAANIRFLIAQLTPGSDGGSSEWQAYITRADGGVADAQATTETATAGTYTDRGDGTYQYTFAQDLTAYPAGPEFNAAKTHRVGIEIRTNSGGFLPDNIPSNNAPYDFVPAGGDPTFTRAIVDNDTCNACHDNLELHGEARFDIGYCVQCHNPHSIDGNTANEAWGGSVDMSVMTHKIHYGENLANGYFVFGFRDILHDYSDVVFSQDVRNCTTCHQESDPDTPDASNWRTVINRTSCGSCHDDIDWDAGGHPGGAVFPDDTQCADCHGPDSTVTDGAGRLLTVEERHRLFDQEAAADFQFNIESVSNTAPGENPVVAISVTDPADGSRYDLHNDPAFTECMNFTSRLAVGINWSTTDFTNTGNGSDPAQPISMNPLTACFGSSVNDGNNMFTVTSPVPIPPGTTGTAAITIDGHPSASIDGVDTSIAVENVISYSSITDATPVPRRNAVNIEKCDDCHNDLSMHGNNRTGNIEVCATCHNPNATDIRRRLPPCSDELGDDDVSVDMKYMIHALHAGGATGVAYEVCGFRNSVHVYDFTYPGRLNNCEGCHEPGGYYPVDPNEVLGTTVDVGADRASPTDDTVISPNTAVCSSCHTSDLAKQHMIQNGGDFNAGKAADSSLVSTGVETCALCHGPGRSSDVRTVHGIGEFQFN